MKGKITKLSDNERPEDRIHDGRLYSWPEVGGRFTIFGKALSIPDGFRADSHLRGAKDREPANIWTTGR